MLASPLPSLLVPPTQGNRGEARALFERALTIRREKLGDGHNYTILTSDALKDLDESQGVQVGEVLRS